MPRCVATYIDPIAGEVTLQAVHEREDFAMAHIVDCMKDTHGRFDHRATGDYRIWSFGDLVKKDKPTRLQEFSFTNGVSAKPKDLDPQKYWVDPLAKRILKLFTESEKK